MLAVVVETRSKRLACPSQLTSLCSPGCYTLTWQLKSEPNPRGPAGVAPPSHTTPFPGPTAHESQREGREVISPGPGGEGGLAKGQALAVTRS